MGFRKGNKMIIASAVKLKNKKVYIGKRHGDCYAQIKSLGMSTEVCHNSTQGFITDELKFLNREDAYYHAYNEGQCEFQFPHELDIHPDLHIKKEEWKALLMSEDLW